MNTHWQIRKPDPLAVKALRDALGCHPATASILFNRNILSAKAATDFLNISFNNLRSPFALKDMDAAVHRIYTAITANQKILIFGDYDVDGVTATAILLEFFGYLGADIVHYIPHRINEGYSIQAHHIADVVQPNNIDLIITADCGIGSHEAVKAAQDSGIDVIITDHHNVSSPIPPALAVINPKRPDCPAGLDKLAGVGVAYALLICLRKYLRDKHFWQTRPEPNLKDLCDLVALGTIADMVPLVEDNRIFSKTGLKLINAGNRLGLTALTEASGINKDFTDADDILYRMAPRINAAGRIDHASLAVDLLTTKDTNSARKIARTLNALNTRRQELEKCIFNDILENLAAYPDVLQKKTLVLANSEWHLGVLGIVASRLVEKYYRPVVLLATKENIGKGSARSIPGVNLYDGLLACERYLENFGGHAMAAGLKIKTDNIPHFQEAFEDLISSTAHAEAFVPSYSIDYELDFENITSGLVDELESLAPFGPENPEPLFMAKDVAVISSKIVGKNHRRMVLKQDSIRTGRTITAIQFNVDLENPLVKVFERIAFRLQWNRWNGRKTIQIIIK
jgi:single-stranded-DNA-specific exonuclease